MPYGDVYGTPFDEAVNVISLGDVWDCAINGVPYRLDRANDAFKQGMQTISTIREQADNSALPGEQSISREELWRAGQQSWHKGAGQRYRDKAESDPERFWNSKGVDVWTKNELSLLNDTFLSKSLATSNNVLIASHQRLYLGHGSSIDSTADGYTWVSVGGTTGTINDMTTDGNRIWVVTSTGTFVKNAPDSAFSAWTVNAVTNGVYNKVAYVNNRLILTAAQFIYEVDGTGALTNLNPDNANTDWRWTSIIEGLSAIYVAGYSGNRSQIFSIRPPTDDPASALGVPVAAAPAMPTDETIWALRASVGSIVVGTDKGWRVAQKVSDYQGREILSVGPLQATEHPVKALHDDGVYVYFGYTNFDATSSGVGRVNLGQATDNLIFAYTSDLMATAQGTVGDIATLGGKTFFVVDGVGIFGETDTYVSSGWLDSGIIRYGLIDTKVAQRVEVRHDSLAGSISVAIKGDSDAWTELGTNSVQGSTSPAVTFSGKQIAAVNFNVKTTLLSSEDHSQSPTVQHVELRSSIVPVRGDTFLIPLVLTSRDAVYENRSPADDFENLRALARTQHIAIYQEKTKVFYIIVEDYQFERDDESSDGRWWNGVMVLKAMAPAI